jgi:hypothetical protein
MQQRSRQQDRVLDLVLAHHDLDDGARMANVWSAGLPHLTGMHVVGELQRIKKGAILLGIASQVVLHAGSDIVPSQTDGSPVLRAYVFSNA